MPELKNTFTGGKMEKDLDERIVPSGQYREALNISVSTSEDSDVGAAQNILGNIKVTEAISGPEKKYNGCVIGSGLNRYYGTNKHITHVIDPQNDKLYRFIATTPGEGVENHGVWMDRIVEYDTNAKIETVWQEKEKAVMVDVYKVATKVTSLDITSEPPPPPITKYGCYEGNCVDIGPGGINNPNITPTYNNDPSCGGSCQPAPVSTTCVAEAGVVYDYQEFVPVTNSANGNIGSNYNWAQSGPILQKITTDDCYHIFAFTSSVNTDNQGAWSNQANNLPVNIQFWAFSPMGVGWTSLQNSYIQSLPNGIPTIGDTWDLSGSGGGNTQFITFLGTVPGVFEEQLQGGYQTRLPLETENGIVVQGAAGGTNILNPNLNPTQTITASNKVGAWGSTPLWDLQNYNTGYDIDESLESYNAKSHDKINQGTTIFKVVV